MQAGVGRARDAVRRVAALLCGAAIAAGVAQPARGEAGAPDARGRALDVNEYRIEGSSALAQLELEAALAPFLGPRRTLADVEGARVALEKAYSVRGYHSVSVAIPPQKVRDGVVRLQVTEGKVGRLRVRGSRWFSLAQVKQLAPSVAEGAVPNFNDLVRDIVALNQIPDRRVTPALRAGVAPGTVDVDLNVEDRFPAHGSLELNDRASENTARLRLTGGLRYDNLWQRGHSLGLSFQLAPDAGSARGGLARPQWDLGGWKDPPQTVLAANYLARIPGVPWLSLTANGVLQDSDVSTLGGIAVRGRGRLAGLRALFTLPGGTDPYQTISVGADVKRFEERLSLEDSTLSSPVTYWPLAFGYTVTWSGERSLTQASLTVAASLRGLGSRGEAFDTKRFEASGSFVSYRVELSRDQPLPLGLEVHARGLGQWAAEPLVGSEQITAGGADSVRGYLEAQAAGDFGWVGTLELRSPSLAEAFGKPLLETWRLHAFVDGSWLEIHRALPEQRSRFWLWSVGAGTRLELLRHVRAAVEAAVPLDDEGSTREGRWRVHFKLWSEF